MAKPGLVARNWGRLVEYMNERPEPKPLAPEERKAARSSLQRTAGFTPTEAQHLDDEALLRVQAMISTPPRWHSDVETVVTAVAIIALVQVLWQVLSEPGPSIIASVGGAIAVTLYVRRRWQRPRFTDAHEEFGDAGMRLMRAVRARGNDQTALKRKAMRAVADWRRLGPPLGADVAGPIVRVLELIGPDRTIPLPRDACDEIEAMVRTSLVQAARNTPQN